jgi:predicted transcriptional regulator
VSSSLTRKDETRYGLLRLLEGTPHMTQRAIARQLGLSLGMINACLRELLEEGLVRSEVFRTGRNQRARGHVVTERGARHRAELARGMLDISLARRDRLETEIDQLRREAGDG